MIEVLNISVLALRKSTKSLFQAFALILFLASIFILLGKQLYKGVLTQKCVLSPPANISDLQYAIFVANSSNWLVEKHGYFLCGNGTGSRKCPSSHICLQGAEIDSFYSTNFNFYGSSVVSITQLMTLHFWQELYQRMLLTVGSLHVTYFVMAFYTFLYLNGLILAIITRSYKVVLMELNASDKTATLAVKDNVNRCPRSKSIVKSPSCKSYDLFVTQVKNSDKSETITIDTIEQLQTSSLDFEATPNQSSETLRSETPKQKHLRLENGQQSGDNKHCHCSIKICMHDLKHKLRRLLVSSYLEGLFLMSIAINSSIIALRHSDMTSQMEQWMRLAYYVFAAQSMLEVLIKLVAFGPQRYFGNNWNKFDLAIVLASGLEILLSHDYYFLLFLRFLKLGQLFQRTCCTVCYYLTNAMCSILVMFSHPGVLLVVFVTICIVSGMQMYGTEYFHSIDRFPEQDSPRWFFRDCYSSFLLVFCMLCGDWKQPMVHAIFFTSYASNLLMLLFVLVGNLVVMNLFSALVFYTFFYQSFSPFSVLERKSDNAIRRIFCSLRGNDLKTSELTLNCEPKCEERPKIEKPVATSVSQEIINKNLGKVDTYNRNARRGHGFQRMNKEFEIVEDTSSEYMDDCCPNLCYYCCSFCKPDENPVLWQAFTDLRCHLYCLVETRLFRIIIGIIIIASVVILIVERTYGEDYPVVMKVLGILEPIVIMLFILEMFLKWTAYGLHKYFKSPLGRLEFVIILVYMADLLTIQFFDGQKNIFKSFRAFRLLSVVQLFSSYQEVPPLPLKRNSCALGSENASRESLLHLKKLECDHFLGRHCRYRPASISRSYCDDSVRSDWTRKTVYTPQRKAVMTRRSKSKVVSEGDKASPIVEVHDCLPEFCYCHCLKNRSLILNKWKTFRRCFTMFAKSKYFFSFVLFVIILSSAFLILEILGVLSDANIAKIAFYADKSFAGIFALIMVLRWFAIGWKQYFSRPWCWLEFSVTAG